MLGETPESYVYDDQETYVESELGIKENQGDLNEFENHGGKTKDPPIFPTTVKSCKLPKMKTEKLQHSKQHLASLKELYAIRGLVKSQLRLKRSSIALAKTVSHSPRRGEEFDWVKATKSEAGVQRNSYTSIIREPSWSVIQTSRVDPSGPVILLSIPPPPLGAPASSSKQVSFSDIGLDNLLVELPSVDAKKHSRFSIMNLFRTSSK